jgi:hypothetical protein
MGTMKAGNQAGRERTNAMKTTPTVHNPTNFEPANYTVLDYYDNKRPEYFGQDVETWRLEIADWEADMARAFGPDWRKKIHHCVHCGNGNVRWITAVSHTPTGEVVVFGSDCTERLGFANRQDWKLAQLKAKAEAGHARLKVWKMRTAYLEQHPEIVTAIEDAKKPEHQQNRFVADVLSKLNIYGYLTDNQAGAVVKSLAKDLDIAARKAAEATEVKGDAPEGRAVVTGEVLTVREQESDFGLVVKMLMKLQNNSRVWLTVPAGHGIDKGQTITVRATFTRSKDDRSFGFGKRPTFLGLVVAAAATAAAAAAAVA